jgi:hypothetical protein
MSSDKKKTLDYSQPGARAPITRTQAEVNAFIVWMIVFGVVGLALVLVLALGVRLTHRC